MSEEVKKGNVSPQDIIAQVKEQKSFGPFNNEYSKCERSSSAGWVQWQNIKAENIYFHYEIIIGERTIDQNKNCRNEHSWQYEGLKSSIKSCNRSSYKRIHDATCSHSPNTYKQRYEYRQ